MDLATLLPDRVEQHYGPGVRTDALRAALAGYAADDRSVDHQTLSEVEIAAKTVFRHLDLTFASGLTPEEHSSGWPRPDLSEIHRIGAQVAAVERGGDGTASIRLDGLAPVAAAAPLLAGAFALVRGADVLVLDLRHNAGGDPATLTLIVDWLLAEGPRHLLTCATATG